MNSSSLRLIGFTLLLSFATLAQEVYDGIDYSQPEPSEETFAPKEKSKTNAIGKSHIEFMYNSLTVGSMFSLSYVINPQILIGVHSQRINTRNYSSGGNLDNGQYFVSDYGYSGTATLVGAKYFIKNYGIQAHGAFLSAQFGRSWGLYSYTQDRYSRENGFINNLFGDDKKLMESSADQALADTNIYRAAVGYTLPFVDGILLKGVSLQLQAGYEHNDLPSSKYLSTKFDTKNVGAEVKSNIYLDLGVAAYF